MRIILSPDFFQTLKDQHILFDTSVFIDAFLHPVEFGKFINDLKIEGVTLLSLDAVRIEFLQGAQDAQKYKQKEAFFDEIIDTCLPITADTFHNVYILIQKYKEDGKSLSVTDFLLGATLMQYKKVFLLTKNTTEFPDYVFTLATYMNISYKKGLHSYGIYKYEP